MDLGIAECAMESTRKRLDRKGHIMDDWKKQLHARFPKAPEQHQDDTAKQEALAARWLNETVKPAFEAIKAELEQEGRSLILQVKKLSASLEVVDPSGDFEFAYFIQMRISPGQVMHPARSYWFERRGQQFDDTPMRSGEQPFPAPDITEGEIIQDFLQHYKPKL